MFNFLSVDIQGKYQNFPKQLRLNKDYDLYYNVTFLHIFIL